MSLLSYEWVWCDDKKGWVMYHNSRLVITAKIPIPPKPRGNCNYTIHDSTLNIVIGTADALFDAKKVAESYYQISC